MRDVEEEFNDNALCVNFCLRDACEFMQSHKRREFMECAMEWAQLDVPIYTEDLWAWARENQDVVKEYIREYGMPDDICLDRLFGAAWVMDNERSFIEKGNCYLRGLVAYILLDLGYKEVDCDEFEDLVSPWHDELDFCYEDIEKFLMENKNEATEC